MLKKQILVQLLFIIMKMYLLQWGHMEEVRKIIDYLYLIFYFNILDIQIPSTLITQSDGLLIISNYLFNQTSKSLTSQ